MDWSRFAQRMAAMARDLLAQDSVDATLERITASVAFSAARTHAQMERAVATRHLIGEPMGIVMGSHHLPEEEAFNVLRRYAQANNIKLREVARRVCEEGSLS